MMYRNLEERVRRSRARRRMRAKIKRNEFLLKMHPYVYKSCITREDRSFIKRSFMCCEYHCMIVKRTYVVHDVKDDAIAFSGRYKGQAYYRKQWQRSMKNIGIENVSK